MAVFNNADLRFPGFSLALSSCFLAVFVVGLGAFTRLVDAGLGCPDWPGCYGHILWPTSAEDVYLANQAYPHTPVEQDKTWPEMVHRYFASSLGLLTIFLVVIAIRSRNKIENQPLKLPLFILFFIILQGMFGMWTVTLKLWPQIVTLHLLGGFGTLGLLWLLTLRLNNQSWLLDTKNISTIKTLRRWALLGFVVVICQVALGGWTTSNYAAVACPDLPTCQHQWLPEMDFVQGFNLLQGIGPTYLGGTMDNAARMAIHFSHRIGAIVTMIVVLCLVVLLLRAALTETRRLGLVIFIILLLQLSLGLANIIFHFPVFVAVAHNLVGALLLLSMITLIHRLFTVQFRLDNASIAAL